MHKHLAWVHYSSECKPIIQQLEFYFNVYRICIYIGFFQGIYSLYEFFMGKI